MEKTIKAKSACCCAPHPCGICRVYMGPYILRLALGGFLLFMSINKFASGASAFVDNATGMLKGSFLPEIFITYFLTAVPYLEGILGILILLGLFSRCAAWLAGLLFAFYIVGLASTGDSNWMPTIMGNFVFIFAALFLAKICKHSKLSLDYLLCGEKCNCC